RAIASSIIWVQVLGGVLTRSLRYQRSSVLELIGPAKSLPCHVAVAIGPGRSPLVSCAATAAGHGRIHFAVANSAVQSTSIARMSIEESLAASRRTSDTRCWSDAVESRLMLIVYLPPEAALQALAAAANDPEGSGNTYQLSATGPLALDPPHAASTIVAAAALRPASPARTSALC